MSTPSNNPAAALTSTSRQKIDAARKATGRMDNLLEPAIADLLRAINVGNGAGVYYDVSAVRSALVNAKQAIIKAQEIATATEWPTHADYDEC